MIGDLLKIDHILDLPNDQGGSVGVQYTASIFDHSHTGYDITHYSFWRQLDVNGTFISGEVDPINRLIVDAHGRVLINQTSSLLTYGKLQVGAGGETAGHGGIIGFYDSDTSELIDINDNEIKFDKIPKAPNGKTIKNLEVIINLKN